MLKSLLFMSAGAGLLFSSTLSYAQEDYSSSDVVGLFANIGTVGPRAGEKTVTDAHLECIRGTTRSDASYVEEGSTTSDYYSSYKSCMAQFVPFKVSGSDSEGACLGEYVSWASCSADVPPLSSGTTFSVRNTLNPQEYEGFATFQCSGGKLTFQGGGCSAAVEACEDGEISSWPVTTPAWADDKSSTVFTDRYGQVRHTPKDACVAKMPSADSGELIMTRPTTPEMIFPALYNMTSSASPKRCFNGEWLDDPSAGVSRCEYKPQACAPMVYSHANGCSFAIPSGAHDSVFVTNDVAPQNSLGSVQAFCWDGKWEIKSAQCALSCDATIAANVWSGVDPRACSHASANLGQRITPGTSVLIANEAAGMDGNTGYTCKNGVVSKQTEVCIPQGCESVPSNTWSSGGRSCSHVAVSGNEYAHNETLSVSSSGGIFANTLGNIQYTCKYGQLESNNKTCESNISPSTICYSDDAVKGGGDGTAPANSDVAFCELNGAKFDDGVCCSQPRAGGPKTCFQIP